MASEERTKEIFEGLKMAVKDFEEEAAAELGKDCPGRGGGPLLGHHGGSGGRHDPGR